MSDFPAAGKVIRVGDGFVVFNPIDTNYELKLVCAKYTGPTDVPVEVHVAVTGRKLWTIGGGGNFVAPIFGPPRIVQGRIKYIDQSNMVVQGGVSVHVALPAAESAFDLTSGPLAVGVLVNVAVMPGGTLTLVSKTIAVGV